MKSPGACSRAVVSFVVATPFFAFCQTVHYPQILPPADNDFSTQALAVSPDGSWIAAGGLLDGSATAQGLSDTELQQALEPIDAGHMALIIDVCNSGQALESEEARRGPMNTAGFCAARV